MTEVLGLVFVAWLVYVSDAVWWIKPDRIVLYGQKNGELLAQLGPELVLRGTSGVFIPRLIPPFHYHFEVDATSEGTRRMKEREIVAASDLAAAAAKRLNQFGTILWAYCFVAAPVLLVTFGLRRVWIPLVLGLFLGAIAIVSGFARAWRQLHRTDPTGWKNEAVPMILSPLAAICAGDTLTRSVFGSVNGLAVVRALARRDDFLRIARLYYYDSGRNPALHALLARELEEALRIPPERAGIEMEGYCPRCHTQLARPTGKCPECLDISIVSFGAVTPLGEPSDTFQSVARH